MARTLLKALVDQRRWRYADFERKFDQAADRIDVRAVPPSESQFRRWTSGRVKTQPGPDTCRVLEHLFGFSIEQLLAPPPSDVTAPTLNLEDEISMAAHEAHDEASAAAAAQLSETTIDQLRDDATTLARQYAVIPTYSVLQRARALREQAEAARDRTQVPAQQQELLVIAGQACALLGTAAFDLGSLDGARKLCRSAALYGETAHFEPLRAFAGGTLAYIAYYTGQPAEAARLARAAQAFLGLGDVARRRLAAIEARACGYLGDAESAGRALGLSQAEGTGHTDDLHEGVAGEFGFSLERLAMSNASTSLLLGDGEQAEVSAARALELARSRPSAARSARIVGGAGADLAAARLLRGDLDGAADALQNLWQVPGDQRATGLLTRTARVRRCLAARPYRATPLAAQLGERIEDFTRMSAQHQLGTGSGPLALEG